MEPPGAQIMLMPCWSVLNRYAIWSEVSSSGSVLRGVKLMQEIARHQTHERHQRCPMGKLFIDVNAYIVRIRQVLCTVPLNNHALVCVFWCADVVSKRGALAITSKTKYVMLLFILAVTSKTVCITAVKYRTRNIRNYRFSKDISITNVF